MIRYYLVGIFGIVLAAVSQTMLKFSAKKTYPSKIREYLNPLVIGAYFLLGVSMLLALVCYRYLGYLNTILLEPLGYLFILFIGVRVFGERITGRKALGMLLVACGIVWFYLS